MLPFSLFLIGAALSVYCLWQLRRWLHQADGAALTGRRLDALMGELVATAETTVSVVAEKAEELGAVVARADERLARLEAAAAAHPATPGPVAAASAAAAAPPVAATAVPAVRSGLSEARRELYTKVYALADAGRDVTDIARTLNIAKAEVQLMLGLRPAT